MEQADVRVPLCTCLGVSTSNKGTMHTALTFTSLVIGVHHVLGPLHKHAHARTLMLGCGKLPHPGFEVLQPAGERKSFKADVRNILYPSEWVVPFKD